MSRFLCISAFFLLVSVGFIATVPAPDDDIGDQVEDFYNDNVDKFLGGSCLSDGQCSVFSYCHTDGVIPLGQCQLTWWFILALVILVCLLISAFCSCICCPCCCLYDCCCRR